MPAVEGDREASPERLQGTPKRFAIGWRRQQPHPFRQQRVPVQRNLLDRACRPQRRKKRSSIDVVPEDGPPAVSPQQQQVGVAAHGQTSQPGHGGGLQFGR